MLCRCLLFVVFDQSQWVEFEQQNVVVAGEHVAVCKALDRDSRPLSDRALYLSLRVLVQCWGPGGWASPPFCWCEAFCLCLFFVVVDPPRCVALAYQSVAGAGEHVAAREAFAREERSPRNYVLCPSLLDLVHFWGWGGWAALLSWRRGVCCGLRTRFCP